MTAREILDTIIDAQDGKPTRSMRDAQAFVHEHPAPAATYLNRLIASTVEQHDGASDSTEMVIQDLHYCIEQLTAAKDAVRAKL